MHFYISKPPKMSIWVNRGPEFCPRDYRETVRTLPPMPANWKNATRDLPNAMFDATNMSLVPPMPPRDRLAILDRETPPQRRPNPQRASTAEAPHFATAAVRGCMTPPHDARRRTCAPPAASPARPPCTTLRRVAPRRASRACQHSAA